MRIHFHFCWATASEVLLSTAHAALSAMSRYLGRPCRVEVGVVAPRMRPVTINRTRSALASLIPSLWRARLIADVMFATSSISVCVC